MGQQCADSLFPVLADRGLKENVELELPLVAGFDRPAVPVCVADPGSHEVDICIDPVPFHAVDQIIELVQRFRVEAAILLRSFHHGRVEIVEADHVVPLHLQLPGKCLRCLFVPERRLEIPVSVEESAQIDRRKKADRPVRLLRKREIAAAVDDDASVFPDLRLIQNSAQVQSASRKNRRRFRNGEGTPDSIGPDRMSRGLRERIVPVGNRCADQNPQNLRISRDKTDRLYFPEILRNPEFRQIDSHLSAAPVLPAGGRTGVRKPLRPPPVGDIHSSADFKTGLPPVFPGQLHTSCDSFEIISEGQRVEKIEIFPFDRGVGQIVLESIAPVREMGGSEDDDRFAFVAVRIGNTERNTGKGFVFVLEVGGVVVGTLIRPAALAVTGNRIAEAHVRSCVQAQNRIAGFHRKITVENLSGSILDAEIQRNLRGVGGDVRCQREGFPVAFRLCHVDSRPLSAPRRPDGELEFPALPLDRRNRQIPPDRRFQRRAPSRKLPGIQTKGFHVTVSARSVISCDLQSLFPVFQRHQTGRRSGFPVRRNGGVRAEIRLKHGSRQSRKRKSRSGQKNDPSSFHAQNAFLCFTPCNSLYSNDSFFQFSSGTPSR